MNKQLSKEKIELTNKEKQLIAKKEKKLTEKFCSACGTKYEKIRNHKVKKKGLNNPFFFILLCSRKRINW